MARARPRDFAPPRNTWLLIRRGEKLVAQINGPVLELMTDSRTRLDQRIAGLGPDILAPELDEQKFLRRLREDDPTRPIGDALIDQRIIAGIGNLWKIEGCFEAGIDPWRRTGDVSDEEALAIIHATRPRMQESARGGMQERFKVVYGLAGRPCPRCGKPLEHPLTRAGRRQPDDILVPTVSALRRIGHKGADLIVPGNTPASFDAALAHGVDMIEFDVLPENQHAPDDGRLLLAHDYEHVDGAPTLEDGLAHLASSPFDGVELDVDLKLPGYEQRVIEALREHGLVERTLISSQLDALADHAARAGAQAAARLVGAAAEEGPDAGVGDQAPGLRGRRVRARQAAERRQGPHGRGPLRRADGPLAARHAAPGARPCARPAASSTSGRSTTAGASSGSRSSASPGSSPTTRGCSLSCRARRSRPSSRPGRRPRWSGARPRSRPRRDAAARRHGASGSARRRVA